MRSEYLFPVDFERKSACAAARLSVCADAGGSGYKRTGEGADGVRVFTPKGLPERTPVLLFFHGGGFGYPGGAPS